jgi:hypothetical protein
MSRVSKGAGSTQGREVMAPKQILFRCEERRAGRARPAPDGSHAHGGTGAERGTRPSANGVTTVDELRTAERQTDAADIQAQLAGMGARERRRAAPRAMPMAISMTINTGGE